MHLAGAPTATLSGAKRVKNWRRSGSVWIAGRQRQGPTLNQGAPGGALARPQARYKENLFRYGRWLRKVGVKIHGRVIGAGPCTVSRRSLISHRQRLRAYRGDQDYGVSVNLAMFDCAMPETVLNAPPTQT